MKKIILVLIGVLCLSLFSISGCKEGDYSRYPSVAIPQFYDEDYYKQLSDKNPEITYNAVVNLINRADDFGATLSNKKINKDTKEYILAEKICKRIVELLGSDDAYTVAASLRFLQVFSDKYEEKALLLEPVLKVKNKNPQVVFEKITMLNKIVNKDTKIPDSVLRQLLENPSWIVSHGAYLLIDALENENLRKELIRRYKAAENESEKLLIITAFYNEPNEALTDFLLGEILSTKSSKIRCAIYDILGNCKNKEKVLAWVSQNYEKIVASDGNYLFSHYAVSMEDDFSTELMVIFLNNGFVSSEGFLALLDEKLDRYSNEANTEPGSKEKLKNLKIIEKALLAGRAMADDWKKMLNEREALNAKLVALQAEYDVLVKDFSAKADEIFMKYKVSEKKRKEYLANTTRTRETLRELLKTDK